MEYRLVPEQTLRRLIRDSLMLLALNSGGVDNWEWYGDSLYSFLEEWADENNIDIEEDDFGFNTIVEEDVKQFEKYEN